MTSSEPKSKFKPSLKSSLKIEPFFDPQTFTFTYVVFDPQTRDTIVIDPVLDYNPVGSLTSLESVKKILNYLEQNNLKLHFILETHAHADHLSGAQYIKEKYPKVPIAIGEKITVVQKTFKDFFDFPKDFPTDGRQFDRLLKDNETFTAGSLSIKVLATPGHTPACSSYLIGDAVFTGDALFQPDVGTGRCDFPNGSAEDLYRSVSEVLYRLPDETKIYVAHDYPDETRTPNPMITVGESKKKNKQLTGSTSKEEFIKFRKERDAQLAAPKLLFQSVQINIQAGRFPSHVKSDTHYLTIPIYPPKNS